MLDMDELPSTFPHNSPLSSSKESSIVGVPLRVSPETSSIPVTASNSVDVIKVTLEQLKNYADKQSCADKKLLEKSFICNVQGCGLRFHDTLDVDLHRTVRHGTHSEPNRTKKIAFFCPVVGCRFENSRYLNSLKELKQHYLKMHAEKRHVCGKCGFKFGGASQMLRHERGCGTRHVCVTCSMSYSTREAVLTHCRRDQHVAPPRPQHKKLVGSQIGKAAANAAPVTSEPKFVAPNIFIVIPPPIESTTSSSANTVKKSMLASNDRTPDDSPCSKCRPIRKRAEKARVKLEQKKNPRREKRIAPKFTLAPFHVSSVIPAGNSSLAVNTGVSHTNSRSNFESRLSGRPLISISESTSCLTHSILRAPELLCASSSHTATLATQTLSSSTLGPTVSFATQADLSMANSAFDVGSQTVYRTTPHLYSHTGNVGSLSSTVGVGTGPPLAGFLHQGSVMASSLPPSTSAESSGSISLATQTLFDTMNFSQQTVLDASTFDRLCAQTLDTGSQTVLNVLETGTNTLSVQPTFPEAGMDNSVTETHHTEEGRTLPPTDNDVAAPGPSDFTSLASNTRLETGCSPILWVQQTSCVSTQSGLSPHPATESASQTSQLMTNWLPTSGRVDSTHGLSPAFVPLSLSQMNTESTGPSVDRLLMSPSCLLDLDHQGCSDDFSSRHNIGSQTDCHTPIPFTCLSPRLRSFSPDSYMMTQTGLGTQNAIIRNSSSMSTLKRPIDGRPVFPSIETSKYGASVGVQVCDFLVSSLATQTAEDFTAGSQDSFQRDIGCGPGYALPLGVLEGSLNTNGAYSGIFGNEKDPERHFLTSHTDSGGSSETGGRRSEPRMDGSSHVIEHGIQTDAIGGGLDRCLVSSAFTQTPFAAFDARGSEQDFLSTANHFTNEFSSQFNSS